MVDSVNMPPSAHAKELSFRPKSLLSEAEFRLAGKIDRLLEQELENKWRVLYKTVPSTYIDPAWVADNEDLKPACWEGEIVYAIVERQVKGRVGAAVIDERHPLANSVRALLEKFHVPSLVYNPKSTSAAVTTFLREALDGRRRLRMSCRWTRDVTNKSEEWLINSCGPIVKRWSSLANKEVYGFHEPRLDAFVDSNETASERLREFARKSHVDYLITGPAPNLIPLVVLEIDGPDHEEKRSVKEADKKKEHILRDAAIPLLRLRLSDMPFQLYPPTGPVIDLPKPEQRKAYETFFDYIVTAILQGSYFENVESQRIWAKYNWRFNQLLKERIRNRRKQTRSLQLSTEALTEEWEVVELALEDLEMEARVEHGSYMTYFEHKDLKYHLSSDSDRIFDRTKSKIVDFVLTTENGIKIFTAKMRTPIGEWSIRAPWVSIKYVGLKLPMYQFSLHQLVRLMAEVVVTKLAQDQIRKMDVPELISGDELRAWERHWQRKWEKGDLRKLAELNESGRTVDDIARLLWRSFVGVYVRLQRMAKQQTDKRRLSELQQADVDEAIRLTRDGIKPSLVNLVHN